jgi:hypothetical protein
LDAYRNLVEAIKGIHVTSDTRVEDMMLASDSIRSRTEGILKGMRVTAVVYSNDGGCEVTVEVNIDSRGGFLLSALNTKDVKVEDRYPKFDWVAMRNNLEKLKGQLAGSRALCAGLRKKLKTANNEIERAEKNLAAANIEKDRLNNVLNAANTELEKTKSIVKEMSDSLNDKKLKLAVNTKELEMMQEFMATQNRKLGALEEELKKSTRTAMHAALDREKLKGYIQRIKDVQTETGQKYDKLIYTGSPDHSYSGLLIDARGMDLEPVLAPAILNEKKEKMYGIGVIPTRLTGGAIVDYLSGDIEKAKRYKKIGGSPLVVKPVDVDGRSDIILSEADSRKLALIVSQLEKQKVAILL